MLFSMPEGPARKVMDLPPYAEVRCPTLPGTSCVLSTLVGDLEDGKAELVFSALDPSRGAGRELGKLPIAAAEWSWSPAPDGSDVAVVDGAGTARRIRVLSLVSGSTLEVPVDQPRPFQSVSWAHDGTGLYVTSLQSEAYPEFAVLHVDLKGRTNVLWRREQTWLARPVPSPDGRRLSLAVTIRNADAWMMENF